jgi:hypothetical protein
MKVSCKCGGTTFTADAKFTQTWEVDSKGRCVASYEYDLVSAPNQYSSYTCTECGEEAEVEL